MNATDEQLTFFDPGSSYGKMCPELSPAERPRARTSASSSRKLSELKSVPYLSLDLTPGRGNLLGESYWELISPWRGDALMLNTGVSPNDAKESSLSQILQDSPPTGYYLSRKACLGILRRASERGKELPPQLKWALEVQSGIRSPVPTQAEKDLSIFDTAALDGNNCGMSPGKIGAANPIAFAANQRDEVRDLHDVAGALGAQPGMKQQTFIAAGFCAGAAPTAGGIGWQEECSPTLKAAESGTNMVPSILCLNDQGGSVMECTKDVTGTLRAQEHGHQPLVFENHGINSRYTGPHEVAPTMSSRYGTGGNNVPLVTQEEPVICISGNTVGRQPQNGGNGIGYQPDIAYTLTATDHHAVFCRQRVDVFRDDDVASTESARQHKDATDLVYQESKESFQPQQEVFGQSQFGNYTPGCSTLRAQGGDHGGSSENLVVSTKRRYPLLIRRLTPLECERLQGFPDGWTAIAGASDSARYKALGNSVAIPCVEFVLQGIALVLRAS